MKQNITVALRTDGTSEMIHGPEVPFTEQRNTVQRLRDTDLPDGVERVELWTRNCTKFACRKSETAKRHAELEALIAEEKAKQAGGAQP